jgi:hypothetical protein
MWKPEGKILLGKTDVDGRIILIWILEIVFIWFRVGTSGGLL